MTVSSDDRDGATTTSSTSALPRDRERASSLDAPRRSRPSLNPTPAGGVPKPTRWLDRMRARLLGPLRDPNPILLKELRATFRTKLFVRFLYLSTGSIAVLVMLGGVLIDEGTTAPADVGRMLFHVFFGLLLFVLCLVAPSYGATSITAEREANTFESLVLSGMSAERIVIGKFLAYFGSIVLVVVAVSPVIGVAFLFGGVSPAAVVLAFFWTLAVLAVAIAFGIAVSSRLDSTRVAIVVSTSLFTPAAMMATGLVISLGEEAQRAWGVPFDGPFWFAEALPQRINAWDAWATLVGVPGFFVVASVGFFLASAVAALRHPAEDRSTPLKLWAIAAAPTSALVASVPAALSYPATPQTAMAVQGAIPLAGLFGLFVGLVFANEPPLPPRRRAVGPLARWLALLGPGAAGTTRFALLAGTTPPLGLGAVGIGLLYAAGGHAERAHVDAFAIGVGAAGTALVVAAFTAIAVVIRLWSRSGAVARLLASVLFVGATFAPLLAAVIFEPLALEQGRLPSLVALSPIGPIWAAALLGGSASNAELGLVWTGMAIHATIALAAWVGIEFFVAWVRRAEMDRSRRRPSATSVAGTGTSP